MLIVKLVSVAKAWATEEMQYSKYRLAFRIQGREAYKVIINNAKTETLFTNHLRKRLNQKLRR